MPRFPKEIFGKLPLLALGLFLSTAAIQASTITIVSGQFGSVVPFFNNVATFSITLDLADTLTPGTTYTNPTLNNVTYSVSGTLPIPTPSTFPAFALVRNITGAEFYAQGSSLSFAISGGADLSDGLQLSELVGAGTVFTFNGREVLTGRFHPALLELNADGTGRIQNSNNEPNGTVGILAFGSEYITDLTFTPATFTLAAAEVPEPTTLSLAGLALLGLGLAGRRRARR